LKRKYWLLILVVFAAVTYLVVSINQSSDYPDVVYYNGDFYVTTDTTSGDKLTNQDLGGKLGQIHSRVGAKVTNPNYSPHELDASRLKKGSTIYSLPGYSEDFRFAAVDKNKVKVYQKLPIPWEQLSDKVMSIGIYSLARNSLLASIDIQADVVRLVTIIADAQRGTPIEDILQSQLTPVNPNSDFLVRFVLHDGTSFTLLYNLDDNKIAGNFLPNDELAHIITEVLD